MIEFVCEIGSNHKGSLSLAFEMIRQASIANPGGICKFQLRDPDDPIRGMPMHNAQELKSFCEFHDMEFMASIFSMEALQIARKIGQKRYKVAFSIANAKPHFITEMLEDGKELFVSHRGYVHPNVRNIFVVPCYPTYPEDVVFPEFGPFWYGYSSHVHGYADALAAIVKGAKYIEKHVTLDKTEASIKDNHFAISFEEFAQMVSLGKEIARLC